LRWAKLGSFRWQRLHLLMHSPYQTSMLSASPPVVLASCSVASSTP
jgi:hypothetical protein